ncbi:YsnF/AvaK domain-containing protein [Spirosoma endophyticum]|uniref:Conserved domain-containing protein n=1 Tax=Spirosoma endophyticum TaxID=662367 RepID=A0A1I2E9Y6_9BACT|nr:YsnF/AvaK domain-containing protein [Spirosoma endophyticum]SFE89742.1 conserved domain-containing protein [Spirosoma endophyticum]
MNPLDEFGPLSNDPVLSIPAPTTPEIVRVPLIEEQLQVSTRTVETGRVTLTKTVHETQETVTIPLRKEEFTVERMTLNQYVDELPATRQEGDATIYPVVKEVLVIQKRLLLVEEIRVTRQQTQTEESHTVPLRREEITIERMPLNPERPV